MAINGRFKVSIGDVLAHGPYVVNQVASMRDFDPSAPGRTVQTAHKESGPPGRRCPLDADRMRARTPGL